jgi:FSR family fosmidomycin resistance protein-like MFS transporter
MEDLGLSITMAASLVIGLGLGTSLLQPIVGYWADRYGRKPLVIAGPILSGVFLSMIGFAPTFGVLTVLLVVGGVGSAMFHPPAAAMSARVSEGKGSGLRMSLFSFGGTMGYAFGPLVAVGVVSLAGMKGLIWTMIPALLVGVILFRVLPADRPHSSASPPLSPRAVLRNLMGPLGVIFAISALAAFVQRVFLTMAPIIAAESGVSEAMGALTLSIYLGAQGAGTITGGMLTDRVDRVKLLTVITATAVPIHMMAIWVAPGSPVALLFAAGAGFLNMAMLPPIVVMAQEIVPDSTAVGSGIVMGLAWAVGSIAVIGTGVLGDLMDARAAALISIPVLFIGTALTFHPLLRAHRWARHT